MYIMCMFRMKKSIIKGKMRNKYKTQPVFLLYS